VDAERVLVEGDRWRMASLAIESDGSVTMSVVPRAVAAACPVCSAPSRRGHSCYRRAAMDLPWCKSTVRLRVWARRFFCDQASCQRRIFAEHFVGLLPCYGRPTEDASELLLAFAQRAGGEAGARLARAAGVPTSAHTLRRLLASMACFSCSRRARLNRVAARIQATRLEVEAEDVHRSRADPALINAVIHGSTLLSTYPDANAESAAPYLANLADSISEYGEARKPSSQPVAGPVTAMIILSASAGATESTCSMAKSTRSAKNAAPALVIPRYGFPVETARLMDPVVERSITAPAQNLSKRATVCPASAASTAVDQSVDRHDH
jgi:hypothetical protein